MLRSIRKIHKTSGSSPSPAEIIRYGSLSALPTMDIIMYKWLVGRFLLSGSGTADDIEQGGCQYAFRRCI